MLLGAEVRWFGSGALISALNSVRVRTETWN